MSALNRSTRSSGRVDGPHVWAPCMCVLTPIHILNVILHVRSGRSAKSVNGPRDAFSALGLVQVKHSL